MSAKSLALAEDYAENLGLALLPIQAGTKEPNKAVLRAVYGTAE